MAAAAPGRAAIGSRLRSATAPAAPVSRRPPRRPSVGRLGRSRAAAASRASASSSASRSRAPARSWSRAQTNARRVHDRHDRHGRLRPEERPDRQPVADGVRARDPRADRASSGRRTCWRTSRWRGPRRRPASAVRSRTGSRPARRTGSRSARGPASAGRRRRAPGRPATTSSVSRSGRRAATHSAPTKDAIEQDRTDGDRRHGPEHGDARAALVGRQPGGVTDPLAAARQAVAQVARHDGPGVVGVDREVRVAAAGDRRSGR